MKTDKEYSFCFLDPKQPEVVKLIGGATSNSRIVTGCVDKSGNLLGFAVFNVRTGVSGRFRLEKIFVEEKHRLRGIGNGLIEKATPLLKRLGGNSLYANLLIPKADKEKTEVFFDKQDFELLNDEMKIVEYPVKHVKQQKLFKQMEAMKAYEKFFFRSENYSDIRIKRFLVHNHAEDILNDFRQSSEIYSYWYEKNEKLIGLAVARKIAEGLFYIDSMMVSEDADENDIKILFGYSFWNLISSLKDDDSVSIKAAEKERYNAIIANFGTGKNELSSREYLKLL